MRIPTRIVAGDQVSWSELAFVASNGQSVNSATHQLRLSIRGPSAVARIDVDGAPQGTDWVFVIPGEQTADLNEGVRDVMWFWSAFAFRGAERVTAGQGRLIVQPNLAEISGTFDGRSQAEQDLVKVNEAISARLRKDLVTEYTIGSRNLKRESMQSLLDLRAHLRKVVRNERKAAARKNGLGNPGSLGVRFTG